MQNKVFEGKTTKSNNYKLNFKTKLFGYSRLDGKNIQDNIVVKNWKTYTCWPLNPGAC